MDVVLLAVDIDFSHPGTWIITVVTTLVAPAAVWWWNESRKLRKEQADAEEKKRQAVADAEKAARDAYEKSEQRRREEQAQSAKIRADEQAAINAYWRGLVEGIKKECDDSRKDNAELRGQFNGLQVQLIAGYKAHAACEERAAVMEHKMADADREREKLKLQNLDQQRQLDEIKLHVARLEGKNANA